MTTLDLTALYRGYLACLNAQHWSDLGRFVHDEVHYNGQRIGLDGYRAMLEADFRAIPDLHFDPQVLLTEPPHVACRLWFDCTPVGNLFGHAVAGRRVRFGENVFYRFEDGRIREVWSVIDKAAVGEQLRA